MLPYRKHCHRHSFMLAFGLPISTRYTEHFTYTKFHIDFNLFRLLRTVFASGSFLETVIKQGTYEKKTRGKRFHEVRIRVDFKRNAYANKVSMFVLFFSLFSENNERKRERKQITTTRVFDRKRKKKKLWHVAFLLSWKLSIAYD